MRAVRAPRPAGWLDDPLISVVFPSFAVLAVFSALDFQGYPDAFPLLAYAAVAVGAIAVTPLRIPAAVALAGVIGVAWHGDVTSRLHDHGLVVQRATAAELNRLVGSGGTVWAFQDARPLVLTHRVSPTPYILMVDGFDRWAFDHTPGGIRGYQAQLVAARPVGVYMGVGWEGPIAGEFKAWLNTRFRPTYVGDWRVLLPRGPYGVTVGSRTSRASSSSRSCCAALSARMARVGK